MIYELLQQTDREVSLVTHPKARRGRGVLFATAPVVVYLLAVSVMFALSVRDLSLWGQVKSAAGWGAGLAALLAIACFALGYRIRDRIDAGQEEVAVLHTPPLGPPRRMAFRWEQLRGLAVDPSLRSLGADVILVAVHRDGRRIPLAEGEPHSAQIRDLAQRLSRLSRLPVEAPKFTQG
jgi:hypothetical protein